jgi:hypothetical protein
MRRIAFAGLSLALIAAGAVGAQAQTKTVTVTMTEAQEVPPHQGAGAGTAILTLDPAGKTVRWKVTWHDLTSPAIMAHIHGPATPTTNAGVVVWLGPKGKMDPLPSPLEGSAKMTDAQWADLMAGKDYVNVHTTTNKGGEIRGQITPGM